MKKVMKSVVAMAAVLGIGLAATAGVARAEGQKDIVDTAVGAGSFTTLAKALQAAGLVDTLKGAGPFTVFAPTDEAFRELYAILTPILGAQITSITQVPASVVLSVLKYHVVDGRRPSPVVLPKSGERWLPTLQGENFWVTSGGMIRDGLGLRATIVAPDVRATNGVIHVIDKVILPPSVVAALTSD